MGGIVCPTVIIGHEPGHAAACIVKALQHDFAAFPFLGISKLPFHFYLFLELGTQCRAQTKSSFVASSLLQLF